MQKKIMKINFRILKITCISSDLPKITCKVSKGSALNCRRSCKDKVPTRNPESGLTESRKQCTSAFLRNGGGLKADGHALKIMLD